MFTYTAPNPYPIVEQSFFSWFFSAWFPSQASTSTHSGASIGKLVLPAQARDPKIVEQDKFRAIEHQKSVSINHGLITTHDNARLDTIEITPHQTSRDAVDQIRYIIKFNGNGGQYQDLIEEYSEDAKTLHYTVIAFNYRGVGESIKAPEVFQDLVTDGIAQVQRLLIAGATSKNILLDGHSLGGAVATSVAFHFHQSNNPVYIWNDRSFATLTKAAAGIIAPKLSEISDDSGQASCETSLSSVMNPTGWDVNVSIAYNSIPTKYKRYMVVDEESCQGVGDGVISQQASLDQSVRAHEQQQHRSTGHAVLASLSMFGDRSGHNLKRNLLISKDNADQSGQDLFIGFARGIGR